MQQATPRAEGGSLTGGFESGQPQAQQAAPAQPDATMQQLEAAVQKDPNNLALRNDVAQAYLERENLMAVFQHTQFVLEKSPDDSRALTYQSFVRMAMGDSDGATKMLQRATTVNPQNLDGWVALAWIYAQSDRMNDAERMIAEAAKQSPENKGRLDAVFAQMKQHVADAAKQPQVAQGDPLPQGHPPIDGAPAAPSRSAPAPAPAASGPSVRVTLNLDAAAKQRTGVLFVIARNPAGGPPAAVKRVAGATFPMTVELSSADSMMGQPLPPNFRLEARLDSDGDAMTRVATDPSAVREGVAVGSDVTLALK
ncbi:MAG TPA: tetratricopeptide repeat protein, partial [Thermoanaerobaculia bacterium]|nr:tetratricopeptide repeat protein [Thermoanaerobaculia bacterium]